MNEDKVIKAEGKHSKLLMREKVSDYINGMVVCFEGDVVDHNHSWPVHALQSFLIKLCRQNYPR